LGLGFVHILTIKTDKMKTTSFIQVFNLSNYSSTEPLIVRPPQSMKVFRCKIFVTAQFVAYTSANSVAAYISNYENANNYSALLLTNSVNSLSQNQAVPTDNKTEGSANVSEIVLDRRGVGYMADTFYCWDGTGGAVQSGICFIWEGEIS